MTNRTKRWALCPALLIVLGCSGDGQGVTAAPEPGVGPLANLSALNRPVQWTTFDLAPSCEGGQLQSAYPLDEKGDLVLVGTFPCRPDTDDYNVFDLSSGTAVLVDQINNPEVGVNVSAHSPRGSKIGFAGEGRQFLVYDAGFSIIQLPCSDCSILGVWAGSRTDVWVVATGSPADVVPSRIFHWDGQDFVLEHEGGKLGGIWGFGGSRPTAMYATGDRILRRDNNGNWSEAVGPADLPASCGSSAFGLFRVVGLSPSDVWATGISLCIMHFDGRTWAAMPIPDNAIVLGGIAPVSAREVVVSGQVAGAPPAGTAALWGSSNGGRTWTQFEDPAFVTTVPIGFEYFNLAATTGGGRIFAPGIGGILSVGKPGPTGQMSVAVSAGPVRLEAVVVSGNGVDELIRPRQ